MDLHIVRTSDFLRVNAHGKPDFEKSREVIVNLANVALASRVKAVLLDVRDTSASLSPDELLLLAKAFADTGFSASCRMAVVHPVGREGPVLFAEFAGSRGMDVWAFDNFEEAMEWFSTSEPPRCRD